MMRPDAVKTALLFAKGQKIKAEADMHANEFDSPQYDEARTRRNLWTGYIQAYEHVLGIPRGRA